MVKCGLRTLHLPFEKINMRIASDANINFIEDLALVHDYEYVNNEHWMLTKK